MSAIKENAIKDYLATVDFSKENWSLAKIKEDMRKFLGEEPGVDVQYKKDVVLNEIRGEAEEVKSVNKVAVVYTDFATDGGKDKYIKLEFVV